MMMIMVMITVITVCVCIKTLSDSRRFPRLAGAPMRFCYLHAKLRHLPAGAAFEF